MPEYKNTLKALLAHHHQKAIEYRMLYKPPNDAHELLITTLEATEKDVEQAHQLLRDIRERLKEAPNKTQRLYAKALTDTETLPVPRQHRLLKSLGPGATYLEEERKTGDDISKISHPNDYINVRDELNRTRMSSFWFFVKTQGMVRNESVRAYFNHENMKVTGLSEKGITRVKELIKTALEFDRPHEMGDKILQSDLVLLGHFFGRHKVKMILDRYGIYADGTKEHPFQYFHFIVLLMGISACDRPQDSLYWNERHQRDYQQALTDIRYAASRGLGGGEVFLDAFERKAQNPIPDTLSVTDQFTDIIVRNVNQTGNNSLSESSLLFAGGGNPAAVAAFRAYGLSDGIERIFRPENVCYLNYLYDWTRTFAMSNADNMFSDKSRAALVHEIKEAAHAGNDLALFTDKYRAFNNRSLSKDEYALLENYFKDKAHDVVDTKAVDTLIETITHKMISTSRQEFMTHNFAYLHTYYNNEFIYNLYTHDFKKRPFQAQGVIKDEAGMGVTLFTPAEEHNEDFEDDDEIPLFITAPGTHDEMSAVRDLFLVSPGLHAHAPTRPYRQRYISALNEQIGKIKARFPNKKIRIEIFGHSLGGADAKNIELSIMEAMAQNLQASESQKIVQYKSDIEDTFKGSNKLKRSFNQALSNSLGNRKRHFNVRFKDHEDRRYQPQHIYTINVDNISTISRSSDRSTGEIEEIAKSRAALIGLLSHEGVRFNEHDEDVEGDVVKLSGEKHALYYYDPTNTALFNSKNIFARHITAFTGMGMNNFGWLKTLILGQNGAIDAHMGSYFYKHYPVKATFNAFDLNEKSTQDDVAAYRKQVEEPHRIGDQPYTRAIKGLVVLFRYVALAFAYSLNWASFVIKSVREAFHRFWFINGYDVPSKGLRPGIEHRRKMLNEKWKPHLPGELSKPPEKPEPYTLDDRKAAVKATLTAFYDACTPPGRIHLGGWQRSIQRPDGLEAMTRYEEREDYLTKVQAIGAYKRGSTRLTRLFHQYARGRDVFVERFYQRCGAYQPNSPNPHHHESFRREIIGLTNELKCRKF